MKVISLYNKEYLLGLFLLLTSVTFAQQQWQYSQYMNNNFLLNPAEGGTEKFTDIKLGYRTQWVGLDGAPKSMFLSAHHPINKNADDIEGVRDLAHHGVGGFITRDLTGPISQSGMYGSYSYHLPVHKHTTVSFGVFAGMKQYEINTSQLSFEDAGNELATNNVQPNYLPDASFGIWLYNKSYYIGASYFQLFANKLKVNDIQKVNSEESSLVRHAFITAGYKLEITENIFLVPSFVVKYSAPAPMQFDLNTKIRYKDLVWGGVSYRNKDAIVLMAGVTLDAKWDIGYSYDINTSELNAVNSGSHEILLGYRINHVKNAPPAQFW